MARTAPRATSCLGWVSSAVGTVNSRVSISLTSGIRELPPTSRMLRSVDGSTWADRSARPIAATVSVSAGRIISSNSARVTRTVVFSPGSATGTRVSTSVDRASLASTQSRRSRARPTVTAGSSGSSAVGSGPERAEHVPEHRLVEVDPAQVLDPLRRAQRPEPGVGLLQHAGVEGAAAQVVDRDLVAGRHPVLRRVLRGGGLGLGTPQHRTDAGHHRDLVQQLQPERPPVRRVGQDHLGRRLAHPLGRRGDHPAQQVRGQRLRRERGARDHDRYVVADPALELPGQPVRLGQPPPLGRLADHELPVGLEEQHRRDLQRPVAQADHRRLGRPSATAAAVKVVPRSTPSRYGTPGLRSGWCGGHPLQSRAVQPKTVHSSSGTAPRPR